MDDEHREKAKSKCRRKRARGNGEGSLYKRDKGRGSAGPWYMSWYDERGKRRELCCRTTDRATAARLLAKRVEEVAKRRDGIVSPAEAMVADAGGKPISTHVDDYIGDCRRKGQNDAYLVCKEKQIRSVVASGRLVRLCDLTPDALTAYLTTLKDRGDSARWLNYVRAAAVAFANWCVKQRRMPVNTLVAVSKANEDRDRRRIRRALTGNELLQLFDYAETKGRRTWYMTAAFAGLRLGDLGRLLWIDVDLSGDALLIRGGKSGRDNLLPLFPELKVEFIAMKRSQDAKPSDRVFRTTVDGHTRMRDFYAVGLAEKVEVKNPDGTTKMKWFGKGKSKRLVPVTRLVAKRDAQGRVVDLHALRTTLGTMLARAGTSPKSRRRSCGILITARRSSTTPIWRMPTSPKDWPW